VWSPDGHWLSLGLGEKDYGVANLLMALDQPGIALPLGSADQQGYVLSLGFSADSRYAAGVHFVSSADSQQPALGLNVIDVETGIAHTYVVQAPSAAWSPTGHLLAIAGDQGASLLDPVTGQVTPLVQQFCQTIQWYPTGATGGL
jgi:hypothetical protein